MNNKPKDKESAPPKEKPRTAMNEYDEIAKHLDSRAPPESISLKKKNGINPESVKPQKPSQQSHQESHKVQEKPRTDKPTVQSGQNGKSKEEHKAEVKKKANTQKPKPVEKSTQKQPEKKQEQNVPKSDKDLESLDQILSMFGQKKEKKPKPKKPKDQKPIKKDASKTTAKAELPKDKKSNMNQKVQQKQIQVIKKVEPSKNKVSLIHSKLKKQDDEYDLNDSFIDNTQEEIEDSQAQREIFETLHKLRKIREKDGDMDDGDIPEDSFEEIQRQEKQSRLIGKFTDMKEEKALLAEQRKKKKK